MKSTEIPSYELARLRSVQWEREFADWLDQRDLRYWHVWDRLPYEKKAELEAIQEEGHDNITKQKLDGN
jgi:hypothetical protein